MCNIVWRSEDAKFPTYTYLAQIADQNSDGVGVMWTRNGHLNTIREMEFNYSFYKEIPTDTHILIHFRYATHGTVTKDNVHPFRFHGKDGQYGLMHNGILAIQPSRPEWSDTRELAEGRLHYVAKARGWRGVKKGIKRAISGDRIAVMRNDGHTKFFGAWHKDEQTGIYTSSPIWSGYRFVGKRSGYPKWWDSDNYADYDTADLSDRRAYDSIDEAIADQKRQAEAKDDDLIDYEWAEDPNLWTEEEIHEQRNILFNRGVAMANIETMSMADMLRLDQNLDKQEWALHKYNNRNNVYLTQDENQMEDMGEFDEHGNWIIKEEEKGVNVDAF